MLGKDTGLVATGTGALGEMSPCEGLVGGNQPVSLLDYLGGLIPRRIQILGSASILSLESSQGRK